MGALSYTILWIGIRGLADTADTGISLDIYPLPTKKAPGYPHILDSPETRSVGCGAFSIVEIELLSLHV